MLDFVRQYREEGYLIVDDAVDGDLLEELGRALRRAADKVRSGVVVEHADHTETNGEGVEPHILMGLMAPEFGESCFAEYLACAAVQQYARPIIGAQQRLGWVSGFATINAAGYDSGWHRDTGEHLHAQHARHEQEGPLAPEPRGTTAKFLPCRLAPLVITWLSTRPVARSQKNFVESRFLRAGLGFPVVLPAH